MDTEGYFDPAKVAAEIEWLTEWPAFDEKPASLIEFLGPQYLNIESKVRVRIKEVLRDIMGDEVRGDRMAEYHLAMITGGIGIGKTTVASIVLPWLAHWVLCLKDPQDYFDFLPGSRIAFMQMSTSESQAKEVVFGDIKARIAHSPWFQEKYNWDPSFKNQLRFPKEIWILPGDSAETTFEGYNILGGILDEADSHKVTKDKDYAEDGYNTIYSRITSRFQERGFLLVIGQMKKANGFAAKKYQELKSDPKAYTVRMPIWESFGWDFYEKDEHGEPKKFYYDSKRKQIVPPVAALTGSENIIVVPEVYRKDFTNKPEKALKDLAGIPPAVGDPFISLTQKIDDARDRWIARHNGPGEQDILSPVDSQGRIEKWFRAHDSLKRVGHLDIAYSGDGDALGFAMGHVREVVEIDGEMKPYIVIDLMLRMKAPAGGEIFLANVRHFIYNLRNQLGFKLKLVTMDGFESTDTKQQLERKRIHTDYVSVDKQLLPYHDLREALYEDRIEFPKYMTYASPGDDDVIEIVNKELMELTDDGKKVDHPPEGSKDVADCLAGIVFTLMGDRSYRKNVVRIDAARSEKRERVAAAGGLSHPAYLGDTGLSAPLPPLHSSPTWGQRQ